MSDCNSCKKRLILKFLMALYNLKATDVARAVHVTDTYVRLHLEGKRNCPLIDDFILSLVNTCSEDKIDAWCRSY